jgi:heme/copper-type cytochrome/quinol oxidase subunit 2
MKLLFTILAIFLLTACSQSTDQFDVDLAVKIIPPQPATANATPPVNPAPTAVNSTPKSTPPVAPVQPTIKEFNVIAYQWGFDPSTITVKKGDQVRIAFTSRDVNHGVGLEGYGISTPRFGKDQSQTLEFVADKSGDFTFYCNVVCGSGHSDMKGQLIVE